MKTNTQYKRLKELAHSKESNFEGMDKVWNRIEDKLNTQKVVHKNKTWKITAIAASFVLTATLGFVIYNLTKTDQNVNPQPNNVVNTPNQEIVEEKKQSIIDTFKGVQIIEKQKTDLVIIEDKKITSANNKTIILNEKSSDLIAPQLADSMQKITLDSKITQKKEAISKPIIDKSFFNIATINNSNILVKGKLFDALNNQEIAKAEEYDEIERSRRSRIAYNNDDSKTSYKENESKSVNEEKRYDAEYTIQKDKKLLKAKKAKEIIPSQKQETSTPLLVIDGVPIKNNYDNNTFDKDNLEEFENDNDLEDVVFLKEPLYIINGTEYSEDSLFGKNPTCPYYPIEKQEMTSISILKPEKAIPIYGKKGGKGIVIISTKNGKPAQKK